MIQGLRRFHVGDRLSEMAIFNGTVYLAGQVPSDATQDIRGQTRQVLAMVDKLLGEAGTDSAHILMRTRRAAVYRELQSSLSALLALQEPGDLPRHTTMVHLDGSRCRLGGRDD